MELCTEYHGLVHKKIRRIPWISIKGWKDGVVTKGRRFIDTEPVVKATKNNMRYVGESIFKAAKEMIKSNV